MLLQAEIHLIMMSLTGAQMHFKLSPATLLLRVFHEYACKTSQPLDTLRFAWEGQVIDGSSTAQQYQMEDQVVIYAIPRLCGD